MSLTSFDLWVIAIVLGASAIGAGLEAIIAIADGRWWLFAFKVLAALGLACLAIKAGASA